MKARGACLIDTSTQPTNVSSILGVFTELETNLRKERQLEGIASERRLQGRKASIDPAKIKQMTAEGKGPSVAPAGCACCREMHNGQRVLHQPTFMGG